MADLLTTGELPEIARPFTPRRFGLTSTPTSTLTSAPTSTLTRQESFA